MLLYVDIIDACHLKCPTCVRGVRAFPNTARKMPLDVFERIVVKAKIDGAYKVDIFSWIEPFLCRNLHEYISIITKHGLPCGVSSTLSLKNIKDFDAAILGMDTLTISISGFTQDVYAINHKGGNIDWVKSNLVQLGVLKKYGGARVDATLRMLMFDYNRAEEPKLRQLAEQIGIRFEVMLAEGDPVTMPQPRDAETQVISRLQNFHASRPHEPAGKVCPLVFEHVTVNADGDVYQCTAYGNYEVLKIGPFLELSREEVLLRRYTQPICNSCSWSRRPVTPIEKVQLQQAMSARMGEEIVNRVPSLSSPLEYVPYTQEGHIISKSKAWLDR